MPTDRYFEHWCSYQQKAIEMDASDIDPITEHSEVYGSIANFTEDDCVDVLDLVDDREVNPYTVGDLPSQLAALNRSNIDVQHLAAKTGLANDQDTLRRTIKLDPLTASACTLDEN